MKRVSVKKIVCAIVILFFISGYGNSFTISSPPLTSVFDVGRLACQKYAFTGSSDRITLLFVPHAHHIQAQILLAAAYKTLSQQNILNIIILCQAQEDDFHGIVLPIIDASVEPCNELHAVSLIEEKLCACHLFRRSAIFNFKHRYQSIHQNFCQAYIPQVSVVYAVVGDLTRSDMQYAAAHLACVADRQTVVVLSGNNAGSEFVYARNPCDESKICQVYDRDACVVQALQAPDDEQALAIFPDIYQTCIFGLYRSMLQQIVWQDRQMNLLGYATSCDLVFDGLQAVETYASFVVQECSEVKNCVSFYEEQQMLQIARFQLQNLFEVKKRVPCMISYEMMQPHGLFVSLYVMSDHGVVLRGCMGRILSQVPLVYFLCHMIEQAATQDSRFVPIRPKEVDQTVISLSLIEHVQQISSPEQISFLDGILLQYHHKEAVVLPLLSNNFGFNPYMVLSKLSYQMGYNQFLWKKPQAKIFTFTSRMFQEE
jgi:uncharacterized protein (TIGR00296 family)/AmmeMemoRadiSam system protein B